MKARPDGGQREDVGRDRVATGELALSADPDEQQHQGEEEHAARVRPGRPESCRSELRYACVQLTVALTSQKLV